MLRAVLAESPDQLEARRLLRSCLREQSRHVAHAPAAADGYPELEATFQATATRHATSTQAGTGELLPTVAVPRSGESALPAVPAESEPARAWLWAALAVVLLALGSAFVLLRAGRPAPGPVRLAVRSQPVGALVLVDGRDSGVVTNGELVLPAPAPQQVVLTFRKAGHRDETRTVSTREPGGVSVTLEATAPLLAVKTDPAGASVSVDGERVAGTTPLQLALDPAAEHRITASLEGYLAQELHLPRGDPRPALELTLQKLAPAGTVAIVSSYPLDVLWRGKPLARGAAGPRVPVPGGRQVLTLSAPAVFLRAEVAVNVPSGGETALEAPALGRLNVRASPDNCEVFVDGAFVDYPPILDRPAVVGRHTVAFRWPDGRRSEQDVELQRGAPAFVFGRKE